MALYGNPLLKAIYKRTPSRAGLLQKHSLTLATVPAAKAESG